MPHALQDANSDSSTEQQDEVDVNAQSSSVDGESEDKANEEAEVSLHEIIAEKAAESRVKADDDEESPTSEVQEPADETEDSDEAKADTVDHDADDAEVDASKFTAEELEVLGRLKPKTKTRIEQLLQQREGLQKSAGELQAITGFMEENNISPEEFSALMGAMAQHKAGNYDGFLQGIQPMMDVAGKALGAVIPDDLQERVDEGYIDEAGAQEIAKQRERINYQEGELVRQQQNQTQRATQDTSNAMKIAVDSVEAEIKNTDVDYATKEPQIKANMQALMAQHGVPNTPEQAKQLANDAYRMTNQFIKQISPDRKTATKRKPDNSMASKNTRAEPTTMLEAVQLGIRNANNGG